MTAPRHHRGPEAGATFTELIVVVLIAGTLLTIALPTFIGSGSSQADGLAQRSLRTALTEADALVGGRHGLTWADAAALRAATGTNGFIRGASRSVDGGQVSVATDGEMWSAAARSTTGRCYFIAARRAGSVRYGSAATDRCTGVAAMTAARDADW